MVNSFTVRKECVVCSETVVPTVDIEPMAWAKISALIFASPSTEFTAYGETKISEDKKTYTIVDVVVPKQTRSGANTDATFPTTEHAACEPRGTGLWTHFHSHHMLGISYSSGDEAESANNNMIAILLHTNKVPEARAMATTDCGKRTMVDALLLIGGQDCFEGMADELKDKTTCTSVGSSPSAEVANASWWDNQMYGRDGWGNYRKTTPNWAKDREGFCTDNTGTKITLARVSKLVPKAIKEKMPRATFYLDRGALSDVYSRIDSTGMWGKVSLATGEVTPIPMGDEKDMALDVAFKEAGDKLQADSSELFFKLYRKGQALPKWAREYVKDDKAPSTTIAKFSTCTSSSASVGIGFRENDLFVKDTQANRWNRFTRMGAKTQVYDTGLVVVLEHLLMGIV